MICYGDLSSSISYLIVITMRVSVQIQMKETVSVLSSLLSVMCYVTVIYHLVSVI